MTQDPTPPATLTPRELEDLRAIAAQLDQDPSPTGRCLGPHEAGPVLFVEVDAGESPLCEICENRALALLPRLLAQLDAARAQLDAARADSLISQAVIALGLAPDEPIGMTVVDRKITLVTDSSTGEERPDLLEHLRTLGFPIADLAPADINAIRKAVALEDIEQ